jgi:hypothetical protein
MTVGPKRSWPWGCLFALVAILLLCVFSQLRWPVFDSLDDGRIRGTLRINRDKFKVGETVKASFTLENIADETQTLQRDDGVVQDMLLTAYHVERQWSGETGEGSHELRLEPGEGSTISWVIEDLEPGLYTISGNWWGGGPEEHTFYISFGYGPFNY